MLRDFTTAAKPNWCRVSGQFATRGAYIPPSRLYSANLPKNSYFLFAPVDLFFDFLDFSPLWQSRNWPFPKIERQWDDKKVYLSHVFVGKYLNVPHPGGILKKLNIQSSLLGLIGILIFPTVVMANPLRGGAGDLWADLILGQPDDGKTNYAFSEEKPEQAVNNRIANAMSVVVDTAHNRMYVWDSGNNRILGMDLGKLQPNSAVSDPGFSADIVLGQPDFVRTACNKDSNWQNHPVPPSPDEFCLCGLHWSSQSPLEAGSGGNMAVDSQGNLYVPDYYNNRVLRYDWPINQNGQAASHVWGQPDFTYFASNNNGSGSTGGPTSSNLNLFDFGSGVDQNSYMTGVAADNWGNLWVADECNNRVLRFPDAGGIPSKTADVVLGQSDFNANFRNAAGTSDEAHMFQPVAVRVDQFGSVYVAEKSSSYGRVLIFKPSGFSAGVPTYINGQAAITQITQNLVAPVGLELDPTAASVTTTGLWVIDELVQAVMFRVDYSSGNPVPTAAKVILTDQPGIPHEGTSADGFSTFSYVSGEVISATTMIDPFGSLGVDSVGNVYIADHRIQDVWRFPNNPDPTIRPGILHSADVQIFKPTLFGEQNQYGPAGFIVPSGVAVAAAGGVTQIIVSDSLRLSFWNLPPGGIAGMSNGQTETGYAGTNLPLLGDSGQDFGRIRQDNAGHLWAIRRPKSDSYSNSPLVEVYALPLPVSPVEATPVATLSSGIPILGAPGQAVSWSHVEGIAPSPNGSSVWLSDRETNRVFRIRNPLGTAPGPTPVVDIILGQPNYGTVMANQPSGIPSRTNLYYPGAIALDHHGYLYVSDDALENDGNYRMLRWNANTIAAAVSLASSTGMAQYAVPADGVFGTNGSFNRAGCYQVDPVPGICGPWEPAFNSNDSIMVVGQNSQGLGMRFPVVFTNPELGDYPVTTLQDFGPQTYSGAFDDQDNLYMVELNRNRVLAYLKPFLSTYATPTPPPTCCQAAQTILGPSAVTFTGEVVIGNKLFVADFGHNQVNEYLVPSGSAAGTISGLGFNGPIALASDGNGYLYVADYFGKDVRKIKLSTSSLMATVSAWNSPRGVAASPNGDIYVSSEGGPGQVQIFQQTTPNNYSQAASLTSANGINNPAGLLLTPGSPNTLYVGEMGFNQLLSYSQTGYSFSGPATDLNGLTGGYYQMTIDNAGFFYLSSATASQVQVFKTGFVPDHTCATGLTEGQGVAVDGQGYLYVSGNDSGAWKVQQISPCSNYPSPTPVITPSPTPVNSTTPSPTPTGSFTPTNTPIPTETNTLTITPTNSSTNTLTQSPTPTPTFMPTYTPTLTNTPTLTPTPVPPYLYPNPVRDTGPVQIRVTLKGPHNSVSLKVFTVASRKVNELSLDFELPGVYTLSIPLKDEWGSDLANGLYYVVVKTNKTQIVQKLLILR